MLNDSPVSAILPAKDLAVAKDFYTNKLGLELLPADFPDPLMFGAGNGTTLVVYGRPDGTKAEHTVAGFRVSNIEKHIDYLQNKGIKFEDYDYGELNTVDHIMDYGTVRSAWFKDPTGNILAINEM